DDIVVGHLSIQVTQRPRRSHVADFGICVDARWHNRGIASALIVINAKVTIALPTYDEGSNASPSSVAVFIKYSPQVNMEAFRVK
ncbi:hypothetical protein MJM83_33210, partial [Salmonella enterica subsp. enterica serovar Montevideo]|nr:hypothetical protein [Salmonella enterica subsp. enterica serovar Montevideo]